MASITFYKPAPEHECDLPFLFTGGALDNFKEYPTDTVAFCEECRQAWKVVTEFDSYSMAWNREWEKIDEIPDGYEPSERD